MGTALTVEYTTVGALFSQVIPSTAIPIVIIIGVVASIYTAYGGLHVSIITDQVQVPCPSSFPRRPYLLRRMERTKEGQERTEKIVA